MSELDAESLSNRIRRGLEEKNETLRTKLGESEAREKALRAALTPSADTKAAYWGEFSMTVTMRLDGEEEHRRVDIPWTSIKEIMAAIRVRAEGSSYDRV